MLKTYRFKCVYDDDRHEFQEYECETIDEVFRTAILIMIVKKVTNKDISFIDAYDGEENKKLFTYYR